MSRLWLALRSALFYLGYLSSGLLFSACAPIVALAPLRFRIRFYLAWPRFFIFWLQVCCGVRIRVSGTIPRQPCVLLSQHQSLIETFLLPMLLYPLLTASGAKKSLLWIPFFGWSLACADPIVIDRNNPKRALLTLLKKGGKKLADGFCVILYPEGTRMAPDQIGKYMRSGSLLALRNGVPVVPVAHNSGHCWPARKFLKYPGTIDLHFGEQLDTAKATTMHLTKAARQWAVTCLQRRRAASQNP